MALGAFFVKELGMRRGMLMLAAGLCSLVLAGCACGPCWVVCETGKDAVRTTGRVAGGGLKLTGKAAGGAVRLTGRAAGGLLAETDGLGHRTADRLRGSSAEER